MATSFIKFGSDGIKTRSRVGSGGGGGGGGGRIAGNSAGGDRKAQRNAALGATDFHCGLSTGTSDFQD